MTVAVTGTLALVSGCWPLAPDSALGLDASDAEASGPTKGEGGAVGVPESGTADVSADGSPPADAAPADGADAGEAAITKTFAPGSIAAGVGFACRVDGGGAVWCWGDDSFGQTGGAPTGTRVAHPTQVPGVSGAVAVALGDHHACAIASGGAVYCWGLNDAYQLGHASASSGDVICPGASAGQTVPCSPTPTAVAGVTGAVSIAAAGASTCAVVAGGTVRCWGAVQSTTSPDAGVPCGSGTQARGGTCYPSPYSVTGAAGVTSLAMGTDHACAIVPAPETGGADGGDGAAGNQVTCWGDNNEGQVSPSACPDSDCAAAITRADLPTTAALAAGNGFSCALGADGVVRCFGDNSSAELGHTPGTAGDLGAWSDAAGGIFDSTPTPVGGIAGVFSLVGGGNDAACAINAGGVVWCWGEVGGTPTATPVAIPGLPLMMGLGAFDDTTVCGLALDATVWCFSLAGSPSPSQVQ